MVQHQPLGVPSSSGKEACSGVGYRSFAEVMRHKGKTTMAFEGFLGWTLGPLGKADGEVLAMPALQSLPSFCADNGEEDQVERLSQLRCNWSDQLDELKGEVDLALSFDEKLKVCRLEEGSKAHVMPFSKD